MSVGKMTLHRFNGDEIFTVESAVISHYVDEDRLYATTFRADMSSLPLQTLPDTAELRVKPHVEVTIPLPKLPGLSLLSGRIFSLTRGEDNDDDERTNFYYCEHQPIENVEVVVLARKLDQVQLRFSGTTMDVNFYDGSKPPTKIVIEAEYTIIPGLWDTTEK